MYQVALTGGLYNLPVWVTPCVRALLRNHRQEEEESDLQAGAEVGGVVGVVVVVVADALAKVPGETLLSLLPQLSPTHEELEPGGVRKNRSENHQELEPQQRPPQQV